MSAISLAAGQKRGYLRSILHRGRTKPVQTPTIPRLRAIFKVLGVSLDSPKETSEITDLWENLSAEGKEALRTVGRQLLKAEGKR